jgi:hypothetical protein
MLMMRGLRVVLSVGWVAACTHLEDPAPPQQTQLVVHGVIDARGGLATVLIYRARTGAPSTTASGISDDEPVTGATVTLTVPNGTTQTAGLPTDETGRCCVPGAYVFTLYPNALAEGGTYALHARIPSGEEVSGTTTIPTPRQWTVLPGRVFFRLRDTLRLSWPRAPGARSYELILRSGRFGDEYRTFTDTTIAIPGTALTLTGDEIFPPGAPVDVVVSAVDANYYDYYRAQSDPFAGAAPSHLTGAVGVFGSVAPILTTQLQVR